MGMQEGKAAAGPKAIRCRSEEWERSAYVLGGGVVARAAHVHEGITVREEEPLVQRFRGLRSQMTISPSRVTGRSRSGSGDAESVVVDSVLILDR